jgi:hypothetical protein
VAKSLEESVHLIHGSSLAFGPSLAGGLDRLDRQAIVPQATLSVYTVFAEARKPPSSVKARNGNTGQTVENWKILTC